MLSLIFWRVSALLCWPILTLAFFLYVLLYSLVTWHPYGPIDRGVRLWGRAMLAAAGMKLIVYGSENVKKNQQYLFVSNHQSVLDLFIIPFVTPRGTIYVGKKSLIVVPVLGWFFALSGQIAIDRSDHQKAMESLKRAEEKVRAGHHLYMAPEGTRSKDGTLGPLKRGAFHLALATRLPIVAITLVDAYRRLPKYRLLVNPGPIHVYIDPAIDTSQWTHETVENHMNEVREKFLSHLT